jgi:sigma-B regulation protein RsbU (phosphoserine phosphatase)
VGGDYYGVVKLDDENTIFTINDISGHGIPASLLMSIFRTNFTYRIKKDKDIVITLDHLNSMIAETTEANHYVTSFTCKYNAKKRLLDYVNAGHNPPFLFRGNNVIELKEGSFAVGMFPHVSYTTARIAIKKKDLLVLYTDGLIEAENNAGFQFSCERFKEFFQVNKLLDVESLKEKLVAELRQFVGKDDFEDDITFIIIKFL